MAYNGPLPLILLKTLTASTSSNLDFTQISSKFSSYLVIYSRVVAGTNGANFQLLYNTGSGFITSNYQSGTLRFAYNSNTANNTNSTSAGLLSGPIASSNGVSGFVNIFNATNGSAVVANGNFVHNDSSLGVTAFGEFGVINTATNITQVRFQMSSGTMTSGSVSLYGILE